MSWLSRPRSPLDLNFDLTLFYRRCRANDVLSLGKIQLASLEVFAVPCDLPAEVRKLLAVFEGECRMKGESIFLFIAFHARYTDPSCFFPSPSLAIRLSLHLVGALETSPILQTLLTDPVRLGQVFINLLSNAIRFTDKSPSGSREVSVSISIAGSPPDDEEGCSPPQKSAEMVPGQPVWIYGAVKDSGPGLAPEELSKLFKK